MEIGSDTDRDMYDFYSKNITSLDAELIRQCHEVPECCGDYDRLTSIYEGGPQTILDRMKKGRIPRLKKMDSHLKESPNARKITIEGQPLTLYNLVKTYESRRRQEVDSPPDGTFVDLVEAELKKIIDTNEQTEARGLHPSA